MEKHSNSIPYRKKPIKQVPTVMTLKEKLLELKINSKWNLNLNIKIKLI